MQQGDKVLAMPGGALATIKVQFLFLAVFPGDACPRTQLTSYTTHLVHGIIQSQLTHFSSLSLALQAVRRSGCNLSSRGVAMAGDNVELGLNGVDETAVSPGGVLCCRRPAVRLVRTFNARILTMSSLAS